MSHTEQFNKIMERRNADHKASKQQRKITPVLIGNRANMNELQESIAKCSISGNVVYLPPISEPLENYADVRKAFLNAGATYKHSTFIFPNDAAAYIERLMSGESVNIKKEFQFFATPPHLAEEMAAFAMKDFNPSTMTILEPSAGQGALVNAVLKYQFKDELFVHAYELMPENKAILEKIPFCIVLGDDFLDGEKLCEKKGRSAVDWDIKHRHLTFDRIIANPPFNKNQDVEHIREMYNRLNKGGRIVTIASNSWRTGSQKKQVEFREWLEEINATVEDIEAGEFKESGTNIATCMIIIDK